MAKSKDNNASNSSKESLKNEETLGSVLSNNSKTVNAINASMKEQLKIVKKLQEVEKSREEILSKIAILQKDEEKNAKQINELTEEKKDFDEEILDIEEKLKTLRKEYKDQLENYKKTEESIRDIQRELNIEMSLSNKMMEMMGGNAAQFAKEVDITNSLYQQQTNIIAQVPKILERQGSLSNEFVSSLTRARDLTADLGRLETDITSQIDDAALGKFSAVDTKQIELALYREELNLRHELLNMTEEERENALATLEAQKQALQTLKDQNIAFKNMSEKSEKILGTMEKFSSLDFKGGLKQFLGLDDLQKQMRDKLGKSILDVTKAVRSGQGLSGAFKAAGANLGGVLKTALKLGAALAITGIVSGLIALTKSLFSYLGKVDQEVADLGKEFSISRAEAGQLNLKTIELAEQMHITGINAKEIAEGIRIAGETFSGVDIPGQLMAGNKQIEKFVQGAAILSKNFGLSAEEINSIQNVATATGVPMDLLVKQSVNLGKGTMSAKQTMKVLATIPPKVTTAFKGTTKELIAAAQKAKLLGTTLEEMQDAGTGMLDIESSLESEMTARVLTGKEINLDQARYYALTKQTHKLQEEILGQAGSLQEFNDMNIIAQEEFAKALGMSRERLGEILVNAQKLKDAGINADYAEEISKLETAKDIELEIMRVKKSGAKQETIAYLQKLANEKRSASIQEKIADIIEKIKEKFSPIIEEIITMGHAFFDSAEGASMMDEIINSIKAIIPQIKEGIKEFGPKLKEIVPMVIKFVGELITNLPTIIAFARELFDKFKAFTDLVGGPTNAAFAMLAIRIAGPAGIGAALKGAWGLGSKLVTGLSSGIASAKPPVDALSGSFGDLSGQMGTAAKATESVGKGITENVGGALTEQQNNLNKTNNLAEGTASLGSKIKDFMSGLGTGIAKLGRGIGVGIRGILQGLGQGIQALGEALAFPTPLGPAGAIVAAFLLALAAALWIAEGPLKALAPVFIAFAEVIGKVLVEAIKQAGPIITAIFNGIATVIKTVGDVIVSVIGAVVSGIERFAVVIEKLSKLDPLRLYGLAGAITAIGFSLAAFGGGGAVGQFIDGIVGGFGKLFGGKSPFDQLIKLTEKLKPETLNLISLAIKELANSFKFFADELNKINGDALDKKIESIAKAKQAISGETSIGGYVSSVATAFKSGLKSLGLAATGGDITSGGLTLVGEKGPELVKLPEGSTVASTSASEQISKIISEGGVIAEGQSAKTVTMPPSTSSLITQTPGGRGLNEGDSGGIGNTAKIEEKLDALISLFTQAATQPTVIKFGEKTVEQINSSINFKKAYQIGIDAGFAKAL